MSFEVGYPAYCPDCDKLINLDDLGRDEGPSDRNCPDCGAELEEYPEEKI